MDFQTDTTTNWYWRRGDIYGNKAGIMFVFAFILLTIAVVTLLLVRRGKRLTPGEVVLNYLEALRGGRTEAAYAYLVADAGAGSTLADFAAANSLGNGLLAGMIGRYVSFIMAAEAVRGDRATVTVMVTVPDFSLMLRDLFQGLDPAAIPDPPIHSFIHICRRLSAFAEKYEGDHKPLRTTREEFSLCRGTEGWKILP